MGHSGPLPLEEVRWPKLRQIFFSCDPRSARACFFKDTGPAVRKAAALGCGANRVRMHASETEGLARQSVLPSTPPVGLFAFIAFKLLQTARRSWGKPTSGT